MRDPNRIHEIMLHIEELWRKYPDWRFMQLINNMQRACGTDMFYTEDDDLIVIVDALEENGF